MSKLVLLFVFLLGVHCLLAQESSGKISTICPENSIKPSTVSCPTVECPKVLAVSGSRLYRGNEPIENQYIVILDDTGCDKNCNLIENQIKSQAKKLERKYGGKITFIYTRLSKGFAISLNPANGLSSTELAAKLSLEPEVKYVIQDSTLVSNSLHTNLFSLTTQTTGLNLWGLDRIDDMSGTDNTFKYNRTGNNVNVYVVDTGIEGNHIDFSSRVNGFFDAYSVAQGTHQPANSLIDCNGHGTHIAGIVGGNLYGVAKKTKIYSAKIVNASSSSIGCQASFSESAMNAALDYIAANHLKPAVVNISQTIKCGCSFNLDARIKNLIKTYHIPVVISAGNQNDNAANYSPGRVSDAITVGATDKQDKITSISNYGCVLDVFAPGEDIESNWRSDPMSTCASQNCIKKMSGTSQAAPFVSGIIALRLQGTGGLMPSVISSKINQSFNGSNCLPSNITKTRFSMNNKVTLNANAISGNTTTRFIYKNNCIDAKVK